MAKKREFVGLYVSDRRIDAAYFEAEEEEKPVLTAQATVEVPPGVLDTNGDITETGQFASLLKELWAEGGFKVWKAVIALTSKKALVRQIRLPHMPMSALQQTTLSEAEQFALFRKEEPLVDFFISDPEGEFITLCFGAISAEVVKQYNAVCKLAGIKLLSVELVQLSGQRGIAYWCPFNDSYWTGVMVLQQRLIVSFWQGGSLRNIREIQLPEREHISMDLLAQNYIFEISRTATGDGELEDPHLMIACDDLADAAELVGHVQDMFGLPVKIAADEQAMLADVAAEEDEEAVEPIRVSYIAVGAALWNGKTIVPSFNLTKFAGKKAIASPIKLEHLQLLLKNVPVLPLAGVLIALLFSIGLMLSWSAMRQQTIAKLSQEVTRIRNELNTQQARQDKLKPEEAILKHWVPQSREDGFAKEFVGKVREIIPADAWLSKIEYLAGSSFKLVGAAMNQMSCLYFADEIGNLADISGVKISQIERKGPFYTFEIQALLAKGAKVP
ncbi:MAG: hypothetical protein HY692_04845 [Cyanobacteria bacterium NC_groundwater_1444_Ag_S-0.65um_54_12]|nr:hypothetical protein [Cyanobacteria bacterium NC_groundwater_1444_Ag_S-0.65um_54_12]